MAFRKLLSRSGWIAATAPLLTILIWSTAALFAEAQTTVDSGNAAANGLFVEAVRSYRGAQSLDGQARLDALRSVRESLDLILDAYPDSAVASRLLVEEAPAGIDLSTLPQPEGSLAPTTTSEPSSELADGEPNCITVEYASTPDFELEVLIQIDQSGSVEGIPQLKAPEAADASTRAEFVALTAAIDACAPYEGRLRSRDALVAVASDGTVFIAPIADGSQSDVLAFSENKDERSVSLVAYEADETALKLGRQDYRDVQARLQVMGFDPNGIDGVPGRGTRAAVGSWQASRGLPQTGFLSSEQLDLLKEESQARLEAWLDNERNAALHSPVQRRATLQRGLRNGWYIRDGKYCRRVQFGLQYCTPRRPPDA